MLGYDLFSLTCIGESHIAKSGSCQDFSASKKVCGGLAFCVSDGHGAADYFRSDRGSLFACEAFMELFAESDASAISSVLFQSASRRENFFRNMAGFVLSRWHERVERDAVERPASSIEMDGVSESARRGFISGDDRARAYGATLIGAFIFKGGWFAIQIGDGQLVCLDSGEVLRPMPEDERCFGPFTTSLCGSGALNDFRFFFSRRLPEAVFLATDGVDKSFDSSDLKPLDSFYSTIVSSFRSSARDAAIDELRRFLPTLSKRGSRDDISIAGAIRRRISVKSLALRPFCRRRAGRG